MSVGLWFVLGVLCGGTAVAMARGRKRSFDEVKSSEEKKSSPTKTWVETRNFLYYDGTEMPVVKENVNEQ